MIIKNQFVYLFGGYTKHEGGSSDTNMYLLNTESWIWQKLDLIGPKPEGRALHAMIFFGDHKILIFGGIGTVTPEVFNDLYLLDISKLLRIYNLYR